MFDVTIFIWIRCNGHPHDCISMIYIFWDEVYALSLNIIWWSRHVCIHFNHWRWYQGFRWIYLYLCLLSKYFTYSFNGLYLIVAFPRKRWCLLWMFQCIRQIQFCSCLFFFWWYKYIFFIWGKLYCVGDPLFLGCSDVCPIALIFYSVTGTSTQHQVASMCPYWPPFYHHFSVWWCKIDVVVVKMYLHWPVCWQIHRLCGGCRSFRVVVTCYSLYPTYPLRKSCLCRRVLQWCVF